LARQKAQDRPLVLATASNVKYAEQIARYLGLFDQVLASNSETNLSGHRKLKCLLDSFGNKGFSYAGNSKVDLKIWPYSRDAILVNPEPGVQPKVEKLVEIQQIFDDRKVSIQPYLKTIRLHQWLKNLLVFIPLFMAHQIQQPQLLLQAVIAFLAFGLCASSVYLLNDLLDLPTDRQHPTKRHRPLAAGILPIKQATLLIPSLLFAAFAIAYLLPIEFLGMLALYYIVTLAYSLRLKQMVLVDVLVLAGLYIVRIIAGAAAVSVSASFWLLAFSMFLFFSIALLKRYSELEALQQENGETAKARGYLSVDLEGLAQSGIASGYLAVLVLALYINSDKVKSLYFYPQAIWLLCPLLLYWISRVWLLARRGEMHEDPVVFAIKDRLTRWIGIVNLIILWGAS